MKPKQASAIFVVIGAQAQLVFGGGDRFGSGWRRFLKDIGSTAPWWGPPIPLLFLSYLPPLHSILIAT
jgi:hypothetical protein